MTPKNESKPKWKAKYPFFLCGDDHFTKECPRREEMNKFLKNNPTSTVLTEPFQYQQQLVDHTYLHEPSSSMDEIRMMSIETVGMTTRTKKMINLLRRKIKVHVLRRLLLLVIFLHLLLMTL